MRRLGLRTAAVAPKLCVALPSRVYMITGGLGGLGMCAASLLVSSGASHVVLWSRSGKVSYAGQGLEERLHALGARVRVDRCDVADSLDAISRVTALPTNLGGVLHAAGAATPNALLNGVTLSNYAREFGPKAFGAFHLHHAVAQQRLHTKLYASSVGGYLGVPGQVVYGGASTYLDLIAATRRVGGLPCSAVHFGLVVGVGMATGGLAAAGLTNEQMSIHTYAPGNLPLTINQLSAVLALSLGAGAWRYGDEWAPLPYAAATLRSQVFENSLSLFSEIEQCEEKTAGDATALSGEGAGAGPIGRLALLPREGRAKEVRLIVEDALRASATVPITDADAPLSGLGMDSLSIGEFIGRVRKETGFAFSMETMYDEATSIASLSEELVDKLEASEASGLDAAPTIDGERIHSQDISLTSVAQDCAAAWHPRLARPVVFVLSPMRSGSSLLQLTLSVSSELYAPQELYLLPFDTIGEWRQWTLKTVYADGLHSAVVQLQGCDYQEARAIAAKYADDMLMRDVYEQMQELCAPRVLVDKTPLNAYHMAFLRRMSAGWVHPKLVYLYRHPLAVVPSMIQLKRGMMAIQGVDQMGGLPIGVVVSWSANEREWREVNLNILNALKAGEQLHFLSYEAVVTQTDATLRALCAYIGIRYDARMANPYKTDATGSFATIDSISLTDPKLLKNSAIDPTQADKWRTVQPPQPLDHATKLVCRDLGYELPKELPDEIVWLRYPDKKTLNMPIVLFTHDAFGTRVKQCAAVAKLVKRPSCGLRPTRRTVIGCSSCAELHARYFDLVERADLWKANEVVSLVGHSYGCRSAYSIASRLQAKGRSVSLVLLDGPVVDGPRQIAGFLDAAIASAYEDASTDASQIDITRTLTGGKMSAGRLADLMRFLKQTKGADFFWMADQLRALPIGDEQANANCDACNMLHVASEDCLGLTSVTQHAPHRRIHRVTGDHFTFVMSNLNEIARAIDEEIEHVAAASLTRRSKQQAPLHLPEGSEGEVSLEVLGTLSP